MAALAAMRLELLIPTLKRPALVRAAVLSIGRAARPRALAVAVTVINNDTVPLPLESGAAGPYPLRVIDEPRAGKSVALNTGIAASTADYIGLLDDDVEIADDWLLVVERALRAGGVDFLGGRAVLRHLTPQPDWVPPGYPAVLGAADSGPDPFAYGPSFPGILMGVNAVIARPVLLAVGPYDTALGPRVDRRLGSCEDEDMYWRLIDAGARGLYLPDLVVHHYVHPERLRKRYFRSWCFWNGASKGVMAHHRPASVPQIGGVPRYLYGDALRGLLTWLGSLVRPGAAAQRTAGELPAWHLAGRLYGRFFLRDEYRRGAAHAARGDARDQRPAVTAPQRSNRAAEVSVVLCTFNRARLLEVALDALVAQVDAPSYEVVVVDNHSTDDTRRIVERFAASGPVRYVHEPVQGLSYARNLGVATATGDVIAFTDDDVRVDPTWIRAIATAFAEQPDVDMIGGKVEPEWQAAPPDWLREAGCAPLALVDYGAAPLRITPDAPRGLIGANVAIRRRALERLEGFSPRLQRVGDGIGSTEDHDFQARLIAAGGAALYDPRIVARAIVPRERLSKRYYRAWHQGHGRFYALMRDPLFERSRAVLFGVPAHVYRSAMREASAWAVSALRGRHSTAFAHELKLRFLTAFARQRIFERP